LRLKIAKPHWSSRHERNDFGRRVAPARFLSTVRRSQTLNKIKGALPMKTLTIIATLLITAATNAHAVWDMPRNPDRFPSFGFNMSGQHTDGTRDEIDSPNPMLNRDNVGSLNSHLQTIGGDFRFPFSESGTLTLGIDSVSTNGHFTRADGVYNETDKQSGYRYSLGLRVYINR
jgi:hypothetical protein